MRALPLDVPRDGCQQFEITIKSRGNGFWFQIGCNTGPETVKTVGFNFQNAVIVSEL
jgi:hypothetical protein